jgi:hypothetical protein
MILGTLLITLLSPNLLLALLLTLLAPFLLETLLLETTLVFWTLLRSTLPLMPPSTGLLLTLPPTLLI